MGDIKAKLQEYCDKLNLYLPPKTQNEVDILVSVINELSNNINGCNIYWSREIFIDSGFNDDKCIEILITKPCHFEVSDDIEEHLGIVAKYNYESKS